MAGRLGGGRADAVFILIQAKSGAGPFLPATQTLSVSCLTRSGQTRPLHTWEIGNRLMLTGRKLASPPLAWLEPEHSQHSRMEPSTLSRNQSHLLSFSWFLIFHSRFFSGQQLVFASD